MNVLAAHLTAALWMMVPHAAWAQDAPVALAVSRQVPLADGEVLAQVAARGTVRTKPDLATFRVTVTRQGSTNATARSAADATTRELTAKLIALGLDRTAVRVLPGGTGRIGFIGNEAYAADGDADAPEVGAALAAAMARQRKTVATMLEVQVSDMSKLSAVRTVLEEQDGAMALPPVLGLRDDNLARRTAIAKGLAEAKQDAAAYAAALGMRVVRIVRVYDQAASASQAQDFAQMISMMNGGGGDDQVVTEVRIGLDVILGAR